MYYISPNFDTPKSPSPAPDAAVGPPSGSCCLRPAIARRIPAALSFLSKAPWSLYNPHPAAYRTSHILGSFFDGPPPPPARSFSPSRSAHLMPWPFALPARLAPTPAPLAPPAAPSASGSARWLAEFDAATTAAETLSAAAAGALVAPRTLRCDVKPRARGRTGGGGGADAARGFVTAMESFSCACMGMRGMCQLWLGMAGARSPQPLSPLSLLKARDQNGGLDRVPRPGLGASMLPSPPAADAV